mmetsp:Transcript_11941/g.26192  ORF Transcript_11941/g.26192 Transcript_11941/m.26192 type:complete len:385 (-) Transcript_11941:237-1391(-)
MQDQCLTTDGLNEARDKWFENRTVAEAEYGPIEDWTFCDECSFENLFYAKHFNEDISGWDVGGVMNMGHMFELSTSFNRDISGWNVRNVTYMRRMFEDAIGFNQNIAEWDVSEVSDTSWMFDEVLFNQNLSGWDVGKVTNMGGMFSEAIFFNQNLSEWDVSKVTNMNKMFKGASDFNYCLTWNVTDVNTEQMFDGSNGRTCAYPSQNPSTVPSWNLTPKPSPCCDTPTPSMVPSPNSASGGNEIAELVADDGIELGVAFGAAFILLSIVFVVRKCVSTKSTTDDILRSSEVHDEDSSINSAEEPLMSDKPLMYPFLGKKQPLNESLNEPLNEPLIQKTDKLYYVKDHLNMTMPALSKQPLNEPLNEPLIQKTDIDLEVGSSDED